MNKAGKLFLGVLTLLPLFYIFVFIGFIITMIAAGPHLNAGPPIALFVTHGAMMVLMLGLMIYYIIHVLQNPRLLSNTNERLLWVLVIILGGFIGQFVYWYLQIWKDEPTSLLSGK